MFSFDAAGCRACPARPDCEQVCYKVLREVGKKVDVRDLLAEFEKRMASPPVQVGEHEIDPAVAMPETFVAPTIIAPQRVVQVKREAFTLTDEDKTIIAKLPKKAGEKYRVMVQQGVAYVAKDWIARGENPFPTYGNRFLWRACDLLLISGWTRGELRDAYMTLYGWSEGTSFSRVSIAAAIFLAMGIAVEKEGRLIVNPNLKRET